MLRDLELEGFAFYLGDLTDRELAILNAFLRVDHDDHERAGQTRVAAAIALLIDELIGEIINRGLHFSSTV